MKLYTEEEIRRTFGFEMHEIEFKSFMNAIKPIELPSDEEIELEIKSNIYITDDCHFRQGIEFLINKIQLGNK